MTFARLADPHDRAAHAACLRGLDGHALSLPAHRWFEPVTTAEQRLLERAEGPVLDIGCGPARHALMLAQTGMITLGIDISMPALAVARRRGALVLQRSIFDHVPGDRRWGTALLLDGNIGIGGEPAVLLRRVRDLLRDEGRILVEVEAAEVTPIRRTVRFEHDGYAGPWFGWTSVGLNELNDLAQASGMRLRDSWIDGDRCFAQLDR
jgi:SAM-dependent methyltransferase